VRINDIHVSFRGQRNYSTIHENECGKVKFESRNCCYSREWMQRVECEVGIVRENAMEY
jgi:hypothetical protein